MNSIPAFLARHLRRLITTAFAALAVQAPSSVAADSSTPVPPSLATVPPVVVRSTPMAGSFDVDPDLKEIQVTFSKRMQDQSWTWGFLDRGSFPETTATPRFLSDQRTCVLPVRLEPSRTYALWINMASAGNFRDTDGRSSLPYLLTFQTRSRSGPVSSAPISSPEPQTDDPFRSLLNEDQRAVLDWTDRQFRAFLDARTFNGWSAEEREGLETRLLDALNGPINPEYYQAINTLAALHSQRALPRLREIAFDRRDKDNRDRWMAIRALGLLSDTAAIPDLIPLVYHGNLNTRWWAQLSLIRLTGKNFGKDWNAWRQWWNDQGGTPPVSEDIIRWWNGQPAPDALAASLDENDRGFLARIRQSR